MAEVVTVELRAKDGTSQVFATSGKAAEAMGRQVEQAGKKGATSLDDMNKRAVAAGAAIGALAGGIAIAAQQAVSEERQIDAVNRAYGDQADMLLDLADSYQNLGIVSDDQVRIASLGAQSLARNYGLTAEEIAKLVEVSADLAAVTFDQNGAQLQLTDVMQRVAGAIRGEGEAAELLGLNMSDSAVAAEAAARGFDTYATTATEAEKAQFRFQLVLEQTATSQGAAAAQVEGFSGTLRAFKLDVVDSASALGGLLGPATSSVAVLGDLALAAPVVGAGLGKLKAAGSALNLGFMGPAGIAVGAVAVGAAIVALMHDTDSLAESQARAAAVSDALGGNLADLADRYRDIGLLSPAQEAYAFFEEISTGAVEAEAQLQTLEQEMAALGDTGLTLSGNILELTDSTATWRNELGVVQGTLSRRTYDVLEYIGALQDGVISSQEMAAAQTFMAGNFEASAETLEQYGQAFAAAMSLAADPRYDGSAIIANVNSINAAVEAGTATEEQGLFLLQSIVTERDHYSIVLNDNTAAVQDLTAAERDYAGQIAEAEHASRQRRHGLEQDEYWLREMADSLAETGTGLRQVTGHGEAFRAEIEAQEAALAGYVSNLENLTTTTAGVDGVVRVVLGGTQALGSGVEQVNDTLSGLFALNDQGWSAMDSLLYENRVSQEEYDRALWHTNNTLQNQYNTSQDLLSIQAQQAPILAEAAWQQSMYVAEVAKMSDAEQTLALAYMDSATGAQALELSQMAAAAAAGELGEKGIESTEALIEGAARANPYLAAILTDMGILNATTGEVKITADDAPTIQEAIDNLIIAINELGAIIANPRVNLVDNATAQIGGVRQELIGLDGKTATVTVYTNHVSTGSGVIGFTPGEADGGVVTRRMGEVGPEMVTGPGFRALAATDGLYNVPVGSYVSPAAASRSQYGGGGSGGISINTLYLVAATPDIHDALNAQAIDQARRYR